MENNNQEYNTVTLMLDDNTECECAIIRIFPAGDNDYIALLPLEGEAADNDEVYLYRYKVEGDNEPILENIESDEEYELVSEAFDEELDAMEYEDLYERLFRLPVDAHACLDSPFKMKMNGRALRRLRDAFYMSEAWKRKQAEFQEGKFLELRSGSPLCFRNGDISETIRRDGKKLKFELALNPSVLPGEFIVAVRKMNPQKYRKQGDYGYDMKFLYVDMHKNTMKEGILKIDSVQPWKERMEAVYRALNGKVKYWKFPVKIRKKSTFVYDSKNKKYKIKIIFVYKVKRPKNPYIYEFFSTFMFEFKGSELIKMFKISTKTDENLKISFD